MDRMESKELVMFVKLAVRMLRLGEMLCEF